MPSLREQEKMLLLKKQSGSRFKTFPIALQKHKSSLSSPLPPPKKRICYFICLEINESSTNDPLLCNLGDILMQFVLTPTSGYLRNLQAFLVRCMRATWRIWHLKFRAELKIFSSLQPPDQLLFLLLNSKYLQHVFTVKNESCPYTKKNPPRTRTGLEALSNAFLNSSPSLQLHATAALLPVKNSHPSSV